MVQRVKEVKEVEEVEPFELFELFQLFKLYFELYEVKIMAEQQAQAQRRRILYIHKPFQRKFILRFCLIAL